MFGSVGEGEKATAGRKMRSSGTSPSFGSNTGDSAPRAVSDRESLTSAALAGLEVRTKGHRRRTIFATTPASRPLRTDDRNPPPVTLPAGVARLALAVIVVQADHRHLALGGDERDVDRLALGERVPDERERLDLGMGHRKVDAERPGREKRLGRRDASEELLGLIGTDQDEKQIESADVGGATMTVQPGRTLGLDCGRRNGTQGLLNGLPKRPLERGQRG